MRRRLWSALLVTGALAGLFAALASADHIPGATYTGTHSAPAPNTVGAVDFSVSPDGASVSQIRWTNVLGNSCIFNFLTFSGPFPISSTAPHSFSGSSPQGTTVSGVFHTVQGAQGTAHLVAPPPFVCTADITWTATTTAPPPLPPPPPPPPPAPPKTVVCRVPRVVGMRLGPARAAIRRAKCSVGRTRYRRSTRPRLRVLAQSPRAGVQRPAGARVNLVVSRGPR